jgi:hypothetical protein
MRRNLYISIFAVFLLMGCVQEENDIFEDSPAERINKAVMAYQELLIKDERTWVMEYFTNTSGPGNIILMKFNASGAVNMSMQNAVSENKLLKDTSLYEMLSDYGPVLTFNTFNKVLHAFSNPENPDGYGLMGDYEFIITKTSGDTLYMKGKKYKSDILMYPLKNVVDENAYLQQINTLYNQIFTEESPQLTLVTGTNNYYLNGGYTGVMDIARGSFVLNAPFIMKENGIRFQNVIEVESLKLQEFTLKPDKSAFVSVSNPAVMIMGPSDLSSFILNSVIEWKLNQGGGRLGTAINALNQQIITTYAATDLKISLRYFSTRRTFVLTINFMSGGFKTEGNIDLTTTSAGNNKMKIVAKSTGDAKGVQMLTELTALTPFLTELSSTFNMSTEVLLNPEKIRLANQSDAGQWVEIVR